MKSRLWRELHPHVDSPGAAAGVLAAALWMLMAACSPGAGGRADDGPVGAGAAAGGVAMAPAGSGGGSPSSGGAPALPGAGGQGSAGEPAPPVAPSAAPFAGYDPSVTFEWPESEQVGSCNAGRYLGSFDGFYSSGLTFIGVPIPVAGNIDIVLDESVDGEFFTISDGKVSGLANFAFPFEAKIEGTLNCTTGELEGGFLRSGIYLVGPIVGNFEGPLEGHYDKLAHAFTPSLWTVGEPTWVVPRGLFGGEGHWEATWTP